MYNPIIENFERIVRLHVHKAEYIPVHQQMIETEYQETKKALEKLIEDAINLQIIPHYTIQKPE